MFNRKIQVILFKADKSVEMLKISKKHITNNNTIKVGNDSYIYDTSKMYHSKKNGVLILHEKISKPIDIDNVINNVDFKGVTPTELNSIVDSNIVSELLSKTKGKGDEQLILMAVGVAVLLSLGSLYFSYTALNEIGLLSNTLETIKNTISAMPK